MPYRAEIQQNLNKKSNKLFYDKSNEIPHYVRNDNLKDFEIDFERFLAKGGKII